MGMGVYSNSIGGSPNQWILVYIVFLSGMGVPLPKSQLLTSPIRVQQASAKGSGFKPECGDEYPLLGFHLGPKPSCFFQFGLE